jgi:hypothetical protein
VREIVERQLEPIVDAAEGLREGIGDLPLDDALKLFESRVEVGIVLNVKLVCGVAKRVRHSHGLLNHFLVFYLLEI